MQNTQLIANKWTNNNESKISKPVIFDQIELDVFSDVVKNIEIKGSTSTTIFEGKNETNLTDTFMTKPYIKPVTIQYPEEISPTKPLIPMDSHPSKREEFNAIDPHDLGKLFSHFYDGVNHGEYWGIGKDDIGKLIKELDDPNSKMSKFIEEYNKSGKPKNFDRQNVSNALKTIKYEYDKGNPYIVGIEPWNLITLGDKLYRSGSSKLLEHSDIKTFTDFEDTDFPTLDGEKEVEANKLRRELIDYILKETKVGIDEYALNFIDSAIFSKNIYAEHNSPESIPAKYTLDDIAKRFAKDPLRHEGARFLNDTMPPHFERHIEEKFKKLYKLAHEEDGVHLTDS